MGDAEDSLRSAVKLLSALLTLLGLIFGCALSIVKASLKHGVRIPLCNRKYWVDMVTLVSLLPCPQDIIQIMGAQ